MERGRFLWPSQQEVCTAHPTGQNSGIWTHLDLKLELSSCDNKELMRDLSISDDVGDDSKGSISRTWERWCMGSGKGGVNVYLGEHEFTRNHTIAAATTALIPGTSNFYLSSSMAGMENIICIMV